VFGKNTTAGNPARLILGYAGPAGQGRGFAPGFDMANYVVLDGTFPTENVFYADGTSSPVDTEYTLGIGRELGSAGSVRTTYVWRRTSNFVESFTDDYSAAGKTLVGQAGAPARIYDNVVYRNSDVPVREYEALQLQGNYRIQPRWTVAGHWTVQVRNDGNFEGEAANQPGVGSLVGDYPEVFSAERNYPTGRLDDFQRHKVRLWTIYTMDLGRIGSLDVAPMWRYNSALTYSLVANAVPLSPQQIAANPGYARLPPNQAVFFGERGSEEFAGHGLMDLGLTYSVPVWKQARPWVKFEVLNLLNNETLIGWDTSIAGDPSSPLDANGLRTGYVTGPRYGQATSAAHYPRPRPGLTGGRTFLGAVGFRF